LAPLSGQELSRHSSGLVSGTAGVAKAGIKALVLNSLLSAVQPMISRVVIDKLTKTLSEKSPELLKIFTALTKK
jgi:hypothetical protein